MAFDWDMCSVNLRMKCMVIGYMHLVSAVVDLILHFFIVAVVSRGFECEVDRTSMDFVNWPWLAPILFIINLGTHGFYPFPYMLRSFGNDQIDYISLPTQTRCYPGMFHVYQIDVLNFLINAIWLKFVISYIRAVHRNNPEPMRVFFGLSVVKLVLQVLYYAYQPDIEIDFASETQLVKLVDISISSICLIFIHILIKELRSEKVQQQVVEQPPSYIECLIHTTKKEKEDKDVVTTEQPTEEKVDLPTDTATKARV